MNCAFSVFSAAGIRELIVQSRGHMVIFWSPRTFIAQAPSSIETNAKLYFTMLLQSHKDKNVDIKNLFKLKANLLFQF